MPAKDIKVVDRGSFFDDTFFKDAWEDFDKAMQSVNERYKGKGNATTGQECHDTYRKIRSDQIEDDMYASQAVRVNEKDGKFQVVMDVKDFNPRDLQVKVVDDRIIVEGRYDKVSDDGKSSTSKAFYKEFTLPVQADIDQLATALSKDGVLTIKAPRKEGIEYQEPEKHFNNASYQLQNALQDRMYSNDSFDSISKEMRDRLMMSDRDSGRSSGSGSPMPSMFSSATPSCASPSPSEAWSTADSDRSSFQKNQFNSIYGSNQMPGYQSPFSGNPMQGRHPNQNVTSPPPNYGPMSPPPGNYGPMSPPPGNYGPMSPPPGNYGPMSPPPGNYGPMSPPPNYGVKSPPPMNNQSGPYQGVSPSSSVSSNYSGLQNQMAAQNQQRAMAPNAPKKSAAAVGSGGTATISVKEEDGKRTMTQETSSVVQERDGFLESKEVSAEVTEKDSQAARREAKTRMMKQEEDPEGRFKRQETADASDVNETCVKQMPDGSVMTVKKSSTSSSNFKQSFSSGPDNRGMIDQGFPPGFGNFPNMMNRGNPLMSQMSTDSVNSNMSNMSNMTNMSNMSQFSDMPGFGGGFPNMPGFPSHPAFNNRSFGDMQGMNRPGFSNPHFNNQNTSNNMSQNYSTSNYSSSYSTQSSQRQ